eukprot:11558048-Alexandrium_andersonii.AAC.1
MADLIWRPCSEYPFFRPQRRGLHKRSGQGQAERGGPMDVEGSKDMDKHANKVRAGQATWARSDGDKGVR